MGRILTAVLAGVCLLPSLSAAQGDRGATIGATIRHDAPRPAQPSAPPPPQGPLVPIAPPSALDTTDLFLAGPRTYAPRYDRVPRRGGYGGGYFYGGGYPYTAGYVDYDRYSRADPLPRGLVRFRVEPPDARVYVDGFYVGQAEEFEGGRARALEAGPHRVELRADGFDAETFDVLIMPDETITIRRDLRRSQPLQAAVVPRATPKTFYVIPGCYAGDTRPRAEQLPARCKLAGLRTIPPVVAPPGRAQ